MLDRNAMGKDEIQYKSLSRLFSLAEIQSATNNFDDQMFIGVADSGKFIMEMLSQLRYTDLVALTGYCNDCNEMILVYEYIAHGTLADHLYKISTGGDGIGLTWDQRLNICIGAACGLDYLYTGTQQSFIHRDVNTTTLVSYTET
ncbi:hypothetical protein ACSBR2_030478 [Camellia fascicularis]